MSKNKIQIKENNFKKLIEKTVLKVIKENGNFGSDGDPIILNQLEELKNKMGAMFAEYDEESGYYLIESNSSLPLKYLFTANEQGQIKLAKIVGYEEFKQVFNEINVVNNYFKGGNLNKLT